MSEPWSIATTSFDPRTHRAYEGLFTLGSGYLHVRGSPAEHLSGAPQNVAYTRAPANVTAEAFPERKATWGTYVPGIFGRHPLLNAEMINLPWFCGLAPIAGGERLDMQHSDVAGLRRALDLRRAVLRRTLRWRTRSGVTLRLTFERFISAARKHLAVQRLAIGADGDVEVTVRAGLDADVRTNGYDHFAEVRLDRPAAADIRCRLRTDAGDRVQIRSRLSGGGGAWQYEAGPRTAELVGTVRLAAGSEAAVGKLTAVATSRDLDAADPAAVLDAAAVLSWAGLHDEHAAVWADRWRAADVVIEGDEASQLAMRCAVYHLLRAHVRGDPRVAIDAKGYAGEGYYGRFFWDTEMSLLPFYLYTDPPSARTLVDFRVGSLPGARANAAAAGYRGARFAWESDHEGRERCALWPYRDHEVHVTADVAYAMVHYARAADEGYLRGPAAEVLVETARYWLDRVSRRPGDDHLSILGVMGPDEYCPLSHNNSYTNRLAAFALAAAAEVGAHGGAGEAECAAFAEAARSLSVLRDERRGLILQSEDFELLAEPEFERLWTDRARPFAAQVPQERLYRTKCLKQADVLMLMMLFPGEFTDEEVRRAWDYYVPRTTHDSSLSAGVHGVVACRLGLREAAWAFWRQGAGLDLDVSGGGAAEGVHIAAAGNAWQMAAFGFAGLRSALHADALTLTPRLPRAWSRLALPIVWRSCPAYVDITPARVVVTNRGDRPLDCRVAGQARSIPPGDSAAFAL
jgi:kojibiose phosphorylase